MATKAQASRGIRRVGGGRLDDNPSVFFPAGTEGFFGYEHYTDPTKMLFNRLTFPSVNCTVPSWDKIVPDLGKTLKGEAFTENSGINGNKQKFKNLGGIEMEIREFSSTSPTLRDVIEIGFDTNRLVFNTLVGVFTVGETISGQTSGAGASITAIVGTVLFVTAITGEFTVGEQILGNTSGATANVVLVPEFTFHPITELTNPLPRGAHEYYFDEWFDTDLKPSLSKNLPRAIWVNGYQDPGTKLGAVYSWTGGVAIITSFVVNTSISINPATTWRSLGFTEDASGNVFVVVNGISHAVPVPADLDTSTLNIASTAGIAIGDIATSRIEVDVSPIPFDHCRQNKGYMFYGNWNQRDYYMSNAFERSSNYTITSFQGGLLNDLVVDAGNNPYTGTTESVYHVVIDSVNPNIETQEYFATGNGINDGAYVTAGYSGTAGATNTYRVVIVADVTLQVTAATGIAVGDVVKGGTSNATARVVKTYLTAGSGIIGVVMLSGEFVQGETVNNLSTAGSSAVLNATLGWFYNNWIQAFKNDGNFPITTIVTGDIVPIAGVGSFTLIDGLLFSFGNISGHAIGDYWKLTINKGGQDTYKWQKDGGAFSASVPIVANTFTPLSDGILIKFLNATGHTLGDYWDITAIPGVTRAWDNFYYALPVRRPGEGYKYRLPSNFWTHDTQEESIYVNGSYGEWSVVDTILSADLQSETVSLQPLKQTGANKVLYPYLTGHVNDKLVYINTEHSLDTIGREQFLEKPQTGYLSDPVKIDFLNCSFVGGRIKYFGKRLYISSPAEGITHCYDTFKGYWQPPKTFSEVGLLSIIGNDLVCHSGVRNQTFTMFTNTAGDNDQNYTVEMRTPYMAPYGRWKSTYSNQSFVEGYITGAPPLIHTAYLGVHGCGGIKPHDISPIICLAPDRAPFGEGPFGSHSFGSDVGIPGSYFNEIYKAYSPVMQYYFISLGISCTTKSHTYSILGLGMNSMPSLAGNNALVNTENLPQDTP